MYDSVSVTSSGQFSFDTTSFVRDDIVPELTIEITVTSQTNVFTTKSVKTMQTYRFYCEPAFNLQPGPLRITYAIMSGLSEFSYSTGLPKGC